MNTAGKHLQSANRFFRAVILIAMIILGPAPLLAQHPSQVETEARRGDHFAALINFEKIPKRKISAESRLTAANSAWALSLASAALSEFELAINSGELPPEKRQLALFSQAIIHFQEQRPDESLIIARKLLEELEDNSALKSKVLVLIAQSLISMGSKAQADEYLSAAFTSASYLERSEIAFQLGELQNQLGQWDKAQSYLRTVGMDEERAADALRLLTEINIGSKQFELAEQWLTKGLENFPDHFQDSWSFYAQGLLAARKSDQQKLLSVLTAAQQKFAPSDSWLNLLEAEYELRQANLPAQNHKTQEKRL